MDRAEAVRNYDWRSMQARVRKWFSSRELPWVEAATANVEKSFGVEHFAPRVSTLLIRLEYDSDVRFVILLTPAGIRAELTAVRKMQGASDGRIATAAEIRDSTASIAGCVPPFASLFELPVLIDPRLRHSPALFAPSGRPAFSVCVPMVEFIAAERAQIVGPRRTPAVPALDGCTGARTPAAMPRRPGRLSRTLRSTVGIS